MFSLAAGHLFGVTNVYSKEAIEITLSISLPAFMETESSGKCHLRDITGHQ